MAQEVAIQPKYYLPRMKSVERISKLPAVEQTVDMANSLYVKVKDANHLVKSVLVTAETTVKGAVDITLPVTSKLERPIKYMDSFLCSGLDYVEHKIPAVKLPLDEMYKNTRDSLYNIPGIKCACEAGELGVKKAVQIAYGATQYGTQKFKDVKECLSLSSLASEDAKSEFAVQTSLTAKRLFFIFLSWSWMSKLFSQTKHRDIRGENSIDRKLEPEVNAENISGTNLTGADSNKNLNVFLGEEEEENHLGNHTKID